MSKIPINELIAEYLNLKDESSHQFRRLYRIATRQGIREFNMDIQGEFITVLLPVSANGTVAFPNDYLDWSMLGIINGSGEAIPLNYNENLVTVKQGYIAKNGIVSAPTIKDGVFCSPSGFPLYWLNFAMGGYGYDHFYGAGGGTGTVGEFTVDEENDCFLVAPGYPYATVLVEYLPDGGDKCCKYFIKDFAAEAFICFLRWKDMTDLRKKVGIAEVRYLKKEYYREKALAKLRLNNAKKDQMQKEFRRNVKLAARA